MKTHINFCMTYTYLYLQLNASPDGSAVWGVVVSTRCWLLVDHCVLRTWDRILVRAVKGLIYRAGMVSIYPLLWQRDVKLQQTKLTIKYFDVRILITFSIELADAAAKAALNEELTIMTLPYSDFKPLVKRFIRGKWSDFWATQINNKLHSVQPTLGCGSLSNRDRRREQLVLCRLRLGHTYTTHRYLLAGEDPPVYLVSGEFDSGTHPDPLCRVFSCPIPMFWCQQLGRTISYSISQFNYTLYTKSWPLLFNII